jgi:hypothetical protein
MYIWFLLLISVTEIVLIVLVLRFFSRLKRSEDLLSRLRDGQDSLLDKLKANAEIERELMGSFITRQAELAALGAKVQERSAELKKLLDQAEAVSRSPQFLREIINQGKKRGHTPQQMAKATGLSLDEVELILAQSDK